MFQVIHVPSGRMLKAVYADPNKAARVAAGYTKRWGCKYQPRPMKNDNYHQREAKLIERNMYERLPWQTNQWLAVHHFWRNGQHKLPKYLYPRVGKNGTVAYFESEEKAMSNTLTEMSAGRFLKLYFDEFLNPEEIRDLATEYTARYGPLEIKWASTPEDIEKVFKHGPYTCMARPNWPADRVHPSRVYGAGDIHIAYIGNIDGPNPRVTARSIAWPEKKVCAGFYGDYARMKIAMLQQGYVLFEQFHGTGPFKGARLNKIVENNHYVGGHIDYFPYFKDMGDHLVVCNRNDGPDGAFETAYEHAIHPGGRTNDKATVRYPFGPLPAGGGHEAVPA